MLRSWIALFVVFAVYTFFVYSDCDKRPLPGRAPDRHVLAGWKTWQAKNCHTCHQLYGLGGFMGPDLTNVVSDTNKNDAYLRTFIKYGTGKMPNFHLEDTEITDVIAMLKWINKSGKSRVPKERVTWSGNYNLEK